MSTAEKIPDELILAAIDRAERHRARDTPSVPTYAITAHLAIPRRSSRVRAQLNALEAAGLLERSRQHGVEIWAFTSNGRRRLRRAQRAGTIPALPESPQHRAWANARTLAEQEIERFHTEAIDAITDAMETVESESSSDALFAVAERLRNECWRLASATYCLREWAEPDDATADVDDRRDPADKALTANEQARRRYLRNGRRNFRLWGTLASRGC